MIVTLTSVHGAPGVTSWSLLLAAAWPAVLGAERVVVEADLDGGVLGARYELGVDPGVVSMIAALRRSEDQAVPVEDHGRLVGEGLWLVPGPESGEQAVSVWAGTAEATAGRLVADERVWLVDAGRLRGGSVTLPLAQRSALTVVVCGAAQEQLVPVPARVTALQATAPVVGVLVVGKVPYRSAELREFFGTSTVWTVGAVDDLAAVAGAVLSPSRARRSWLWRTALDLAGSVAASTQQITADRDAPTNGDHHADAEALP